MSKFLVSELSFIVIAISLTPEMTTGLSILVAAIFVGLVNLYMARTARLVQMKELEKAIRPIEAKIDAIAPVVAKIDGHVNSEKTRAESELAAKDLQIVLQRETIEELKKVAALLAQAKATTDMTTAVAQAAMAGAMTPQSGMPPSDRSPAVLRQIETNTGETAANTQRTEATVKQLKESADSEGDA